jgi:hypothetical protein
MPLSRKRPRWKGELARPIRPKVKRPRGLAVTNKKTVARANDEMKGLYQQAINEEYQTKLNRLMEHYGIANKNDFSSLALALAIDHVPGFRIIDPTPPRLEKISDDGLALVVQDNNRGRRLVWTLERLNDLLTAVESTRRRHSRSTDREALLLVARHGNWLRPGNHRGSHEQWIETLESRLQDAKRIKRIADRDRKLLEKIADELSGQNSGNPKPV